MKTITITELSTSIIYTINVNHIAYYHRSGDDYKSEINLSNGKKIITNLSTDALANKISVA